MNQKFIHQQKGFIEIAGIGFTILGLLASVVLLSLNSARAKSRDAKRIADIRQLSSAIELYGYDYNAVPANLAKLTPTYIGIIPTAPLPPDGTCSETDNAYSYAKIAAKSYEISFCLGQNTGGFSAGKHILTEKGIK